MEMRVDTSIGLRGGEMLTSHRIPDTGRLQQTSSLQLKSKPITRHAKIQNFSPAWGLGDVTVPMSMTVRIHSVERRILLPMRCLRQLRASRQNDRKAVPCGIARHGHRKGTADSALRPKRLRAGRFEGPAA